MEEYSHNFLDEAILGSNSMDAECMNISDTRPQAEIEETIRAMTRAIEQDSSNAQAYFKRGNAFSNMGDYDRAIDDLSKTIELNPSNSMAFNNRGMALWAVGRREDAVADYEKAKTLMGSRPG